MARKSAPESQDPALLRVLREEAEAKIIHQIRKGNELLEVVIQSSQQYETTRNSYYKWTEYNEELLKRIFTSDRFARQYRGISFGISANSLQEAVNGLYDDIKSHVRRLESIKDRLELIELAPEVASPPIEAPDKGRTTQMDEKINMENQPDPRKVFVVHGRNSAVRSRMFDFLRCLGLEPLEWEKMRHLTGKASPTTLEIIERGFSEAQAIVVLLTGDDLVRLKDEFIPEGDSKQEGKETPQARPNVIFEAGMAFGICKERTLLMEYGDVNTFSDVDGINVVRVSTSPTPAAIKNTIAGRLRTAGCDVDTHGNDWLEVDLMPQAQSDALPQSTSSTQNVSNGANAFKPKTPDKSDPRIEFL